MSAIRPYTRSLHPDDYGFLAHAAPLRTFQSDMARDKVPHREWHPHRVWEYASVMMQLDTLAVPHGARLIDVGSGGSFFPPYLATIGGYPDLTLTDSMKYGDVTQDVEAQRAHFNIALPLYDVLCEDMAILVADSYDVTMCISTIEHVDADKHDDALRELYRITRPGGYIFITSDYFRDLAQFEASPSRHLQFTPYTEEFVLSIPGKLSNGVEFVGDTDLGYCGDFIHGAYSFVNIVLRKQ